jgi:hypothetical protein
VKKTLQGTKQDQPDLRISDSDLTIQKVCPRPCESVSAPGEPRTLAQQGPVTVLAVLESAPQRCHAWELGRHDTCAVSQYFSTAKMATLVRTGYFLKPPYWFIFPRYTMLHVFFLEKNCAERRVILLHTLLFLTRE